MANPTWAELSKLRWGPALLPGNQGPGIVLPPGWRSDVAAWNDRRWREWRARVTALLAGQPQPEPRQIKATEWQAYRELLQVGSPDPTPGGTDGQ
jgi:hypothetical protein